MYCIHVFEATIYLIWVMSNVKHMHVSQCKFSTLKACSQYKCCCQVVVHSEGWGENGRKQTGDEASSGGHSWEAELSDQEWVSMNKIESKYSICDIIHSELTLYDRGYIVWNFVFTETMDNLSMAFWVCSGSQISQYPMLQLHPPLVLIFDLSPPHHKSQIGQWMLIQWSPWAGTPPVYRDLPRSIPKPMYQGMPKIG